MNVLSAGNELDLVVTGPSCLSGPRVMHRKYLRDGDMENYHPVTEWFDRVLKRFRTRISDDIVSTSTYIRLPETVQSHIHSQVILQFDDLNNARVVYTHLKADISKHAQQTESNDFESA